MSRFLNLLAALVSFGAFAALVLWGITLSTLDPSDIPVIKKAEGPARVAPDDPGGEVAGSQGLAVNVVQSRGEAAATSDQVTLAPRANPLQAEDVAGVDIENRLPEADAASSDLSEIEGQIVKDMEAAADNVVTRASDLNEDLKAADATAMAKAKALFGITESQEKNIELAALQVEADGATKVQITKNDATAPVKKGIRPKRRPENLVATTAKKPEAEEAKEEVVAAVVEATPSGKPKAGTPVIQLGAYLSQKIADEEWAKLSKAHSDLLGKTTAYNTKIEANGKTYTRLRVHGFASEAEAKALCVALKARKTDCLFAKER